MPFRFCFPQFLSFILCTTGCCPTLLTTCCLWLSLSASSHGYGNLELLVQPVISRGFCLSQWYCGRRRCKNRLLAGLWEAILCLFSLEKECKRPCFAAILGFGVSGDGFWHGPSLRVHTWTLGHHMFVDTFSLAPLTCLIVGFAWLPTLRA